MVLCIVTDKSEKHNVEQQKKQDPEVWFPLHRIQKQSKLKSILQK